MAYDGEDAKKNKTKQNENECCKLYGSSKLLLLLLKKNDGGKDIHRDELHC